MKTKTVYRTPWFQLVAKPASGVAPFYSLRLPDYVSVLAFTRGGNALMVRQYRPAVERVTLELPSGLVDAGRTPLQTARRELLEETGFRARRLVRLGRPMYPDAGRLGNRLWAFVATGAERVAEPEAGIEVVQATPERLRRLLRAGEFHHAINIAVLALAAERGILRWR